MPRDLFGDVTRPSISVGSRKWYTVPLSLAAHVAAIVPIILVPLLASDVLPLPRAYDVFVIDTPTPPDPPAPPQPIRETPKPVGDPNRAPIDTPNGIPPEPLGGFEETEHVAAPGLVVGSVDTDGIAAPPSPAPAPPKPPVEPVRAGTFGVRMPAKIRDVQPRYSPLALASRAEGLVILEAVIGVDGRVRDLRVLRGHPILSDLALEAVRQWEYTPSQLNGVPVPVIMTVTVTFSLTK